MYKKYYGIVFLIVIVFTLTIISIKYGPQNPDYQILQPVKDIKVESMQISNTTVKRGETLEVTATIYNASRDVQSTSSAVYMIGNDKIYDGSNAEYISNKHIVDIAPKTSEKLKWLIPLYFPVGDYRFMVGLHSFNNGIDKFAEDYWYKKNVTLEEPTAVLRVMTGENQSQNGTSYISDSAFSPLQVKNNENLVASFKVKNNGVTRKIVAGVYVINKNKYYTSHNQDLSFETQTKTISSGDSEIFEWSTANSLQAGTYRVMYWIHYLNESEQEIWIQDYWLPGYLEVVNDEQN